MFSMRFLLIITILISLSACASTFDLRSEKAAEALDKYPTCEESDLFIPLVNLTERERRCVFTKMMNEKKIKRDQEEKERQQLADSKREKQRRARIDFKKSPQGDETKENCLKVIKDVEQRYITSNDGILVNYYHKNGFDVCVIEISYESLTGTIRRVISATYNQSNGIYEVDM